MSSLDCQRHLFDIPDDQHYINCAYMSPLLKSIEQVGRDSLVAQKHPYDIGVSDFFEPVTELKQNFARLIGASEPERIAVIPSVSYGIANVTHNIRLDPGQNVVIAAEQFPSNVYPWMDLCERNGANLVQVSRPRSSANWSEAIIDSINANTAVVSMGHVHWADGHVFDLEAVSAKVRSVGSLLVIDGTQSIGAMHFPLETIRPDALICAGYKWLMGPYMIGVAYYGPYFDDKAPIEHNWINRLNSHDFKELVNYQPRFRPLANRFSVGEQSNFLLTPMLSKSIAQVLQWGVDGIQEYCSSLVAPYLDRWRSMGYGISQGESLSPHLFGVRVPDTTNADAIKPLLGKHRVSVSFRGDAVRVAPHVYNNAGDMEALDRVFVELRDH